MRRLPPTPPLVRWNEGSCDGPVENLANEGLFDLRQDHVLKRWNNDNLPHHEMTASVAFGWKEEALLAWERSGEAKLPPFGDEITAFARTPRVQAMAC